MEGFDIGERACLADGELSLYVTQRTGRFGLLRLALRAPDRPAAARPAISTC